MNDKEQQIIQLYQEENLSTHHIADKFSTYPNKIRRILKKHGVQLRGKGEAQKIALEQGRTEHPTKGKVMKDSTKFKISEKQGELWDNMTAKQRQERVDNGKDSWNKKTASERQDIIKKAHEAVQEASRIGSKMENYLLQNIMAIEFLSLTLFLAHQLKNQTGRYLLIKQQIIHCLTILLFKIQ